jgi:transcriptional regulator with XRE-family HTH domain
VNTAPPAQRRLVGGALRRYRENLGYTLEDAARILECDRSKISRVESGHRGIRSKELRELLVEYGADEQQAILTAIANPRGPRGWYEAYADVLPAPYRDYLFMETLASRVMIYEAQQIPALLQTPAYARALAETGPLDNDAQEMAIEAMFARQKAILEDRTADIHVIIGEAALHQEVGGPRVMQGQLELLTGISTISDTITVQILPFSIGAHAGAAVGSLAILQFPHAPGLEVVHLGGASGGVCLDSQEDLATYTRLYEQLRLSALTPAQSDLLLWGETVS